ncbi:PilW family protein [Undibacterium sp. Xuan67W]|uniref:PilW family protein n=1 Tax=Undibacterium sp. Xuan67W TaxID=3413057 RepID=UPI003BF19C13
MIINRYERQKGRSLVEVMIALTIGLVLLIGIASVFISNKQTFKTTDDKGRLEEEGRLALNLLAFHLRMAGYGELTSAVYVNPNNTNLQSGANAIAQMNGLEGCSGGFANAAASTVARSCATSPPSTAADAIIVRYVVDQNNANQSAGAPTDCLGAAIIRVPAVVENRFFIANNATTGLPELHCQGSGQTAAAAATFTSLAQPIAENIIDMKISYGYGYDYVNQRDTQSVDSFISASQVDAMTPPTVGTPWSKVVSVKICFVARSANDRITTAPQLYIDCGGTTKTATDRRLYQTFSTVVAIRRSAAGSLN